MRLTVIILFITCLSISAKVTAQRVTLSGQKLPLGRIINEIKRQTNFTFFYNSQLLALANPVDIDVNDVPIKQALDICFANQPLAYKIFSKSVIIRQKDAIVSSLGGTVIPGPINLRINVIGKVYNETGEAVEGVTVTIKGTGFSTYTNSLGEFTLKSIDKNAILDFSAVNMEPGEVKLNGQKELVVRLKTKVSALQDVEVVVSTGYQDLPGDRVAGSFVKINNELFNRKVGATVLDRIYDVASGLLYTRSTKGLNLNGLPPLQIRGASTINANKDPLIVIDNFPYDGDLNILNPNDIESVTILKDAAAASIWGVRSGNGVIVITTKKGKFNQKTKVTFNTNITIGQKPDLFYIPIINSGDVVAYEKMKFADSAYNIYDDYYPVINQFKPLPQVAEILLALRKGIIAKETAETQISFFRNHDVRSDINKYLLQNSINQQYAVNIFGGGISYKYYSSIGFDDNRPVETGNHKKRFSFRMNNSWKPIEAIEITGEINYIQSSSIGSDVSYSNLLPLGNMKSPYSRLADDDGNALAIPQSYRLAYVDTATYPALLDWHYFPLEELKQNIVRNQQNDIRLVATLKYTPIAGLNFVLHYQYHKNFNNSITRNSEKSFIVRDGVNKYMNVQGGVITYPYPLGNRVSISDNESINWNLRFQVNFEKTFKHHNISVTGGSEIRESILNTFNNVILGLNNDLSDAPVVDYITRFPIRPAGIRTVDNGQETSNLNDNLFRNGSYFLNTGYSFKSKYLLSFSARMDQANLFGVKANQRRIPLWSTGIGWVISKEDYFQIPWINYLKLRTTFGFNGNVSLSTTAFPTIFMRNNYSGVPTGALYAQIRTPNNPQLRWEKVKILNLAADYQLIDGRLYGSIDFYFKKGIDLIGPIDADPTSGRTTYIGNYASINGNGFDFVLNTRNFDRRFKWVTNILFSYNTDKVSEYDGQLNLKAFNLVDGYPIQTGRPLYAMNSYKFAGLDPATGVPKIYLADTISNYSNYNEGTVSDIFYHGSRSPRIFGSVINTILWKNISFSFNIIYKLKYYFRRSTFDYNSLYYGWGGHSDYSLRWKKPGDEVLTTVPAIPEKGTDNRFQVYSQSDILVERGDHIRLQDIRVNYDINTGISKRRLFKNIQVYFYVQNLGIIWRANNYKIDPDAYTFGSMPAPKSFSFGLTINY